VGRIDHEAAVYKDIEKFYRVIGYYEGQEMMPLDVHERHIQNGLEAHLRDPREYLRRLQYNLQMTDVQCGTRSIYQAEKPELSLVYTLFSEGIQSLIALRDLSAHDLKEWCLLVRKTLLEFDDGNIKDLASVLWRSPSRNIRTRVYNLLSDLEETAISHEEGESLKHKHGWHNRDQEWDLPEARDLKRLRSDCDPVAPDRMNQMKQQLQSLDVGGDVPAELKLTADEISTLSHELSFFDQNHIDFNLLNLFIQNAASNKNLEPSLLSFIEDFLGNLSKGVVNRFQPSLIFFMLHEIQNLSGGPLKELKARIETEITKTLRQPANEKRLISSLKDPTRSEVTKKLFPYLDPEQFSTVIDFYLTFNDKDGLVEFLKVILEQNSDADNIIFGWGEERLSQILPLFRRLEWPKKYDFLKRAVRSSSTKVAKQASYYIPNINFETTLALQSYKAQPDEIREIWMKAFLDQPIRENWIPFFAELFSSGLWASANSKVLGHRISMGWVEVAFRYTKGKAVEWIKPWVASRRFFFWPRYPELRECCLLPLIQQKTLQAIPEVLNLIKSESALPFQNTELRTLLKGSVRR
jgi:hypothetical protein